MTVNATDLHGLFPVHYDSHVAPVSDFITINQAPMPSQYSLHDTVEISDGARRMYEDSKKTEDTEKTATREDDDEMRSRRVRDLLDKLVPQKRDIARTIDKVLKAQGLTPGKGQNLKIEIDAKGKIVAGGIEDVRLTKRIQDALNNEDGLAAQLNSYKKAEQSLNADLNALSGWDLASIRRDKLAGEKSAVENGQTVDEDYVFGAHEFFRDNSDIASGVSELVDIRGIDFSSEERGVADPKAALEKILNTAKQWIQAGFDGYNKKIKETSESPEMAAQRTISLDNVKISINGEGKIVIEGEFSKSRQDNAEANSIVNTILNEMMAADEDLGIESIFHTAMRQLTVNHDDEFGEREGIAKQALVAIDGGQVGVSVSAPGARKAIKSDIRDIAAEALSMELNTEVSAASIEVDNEGKIKLVGLEDDAGAIKAREAIEKFNELVRNKALNPGAENGDAPDTLAVRAEKIAKLVKELQTYTVEPEEEEGGNENDFDVEEEEKSARQIHAEEERRKAVESELRLSAEEFAELSDFEKNSLRDRMYKRWTEGGGEFDPLTN